MDFCLRGSADRNQMTFAAVEIAKNMRELVDRVERPTAELVALALIRIELVKDAAEQREIIRGSDFRTLGRLFEQVAIAIGELVDVIGQPDKARSLAVKICDLLKQACAILNCPQVN